jgi:hypothetical protein
MKKFLSNLYPMNLIVLLLFFILSVIFTYPLITNLATQIPGDIPVDPPIFLWNSWNFRDALQQPPHDPFISRRIFYPFELNAVFHDYTVFRNAVVTALSGFINPVSAFNIVTLLMYCFSGFGGYLLTLRFVPNRYAAFISGFIFSFCSYKMARLSGHYSLTDAAFIPFYILYLYKSFETNKLRYPIIAGLLLAFTGYCSYYYLVFLILFTILFVAYHFIPEFNPYFIKNNFIQLKKSGNKAIKILRNINLLIGIPAAFIALYVILIGPIKPPPFSARSATRAMLILVLLLMVNWSTRYKINLRSWIKSFSETSLKLFNTGKFKAVVIMLCTFVIVFSPVIINLLNNFDEYPSDVGKVIDYPRVGDFFSLPGRGNASLNKYIFNIAGNPIERRVYLGIIPLILCIIATKKIRTQTSLKFWLFIGAVFLILSLGPSLKVGERGLFWLPYNIIQTLPFVRGAREPSRYLILTMLAIGILSAVAIENIINKIRKAAASIILLPVFSVMLFSFIAADYITVPNDMIDLSTPDIYRKIGTENENYSILEIPFKIQGKGRELGGENYRYGLYQYYQSVHQKNLLSGYLAYVPYKIFDYFESISFIRDISALQNNCIKNDAKKEIWKKPYCLEASRLLALYDIRYIFIHKNDLSKYSLYYLVKYLKKQLTTQLIEIENSPDLLVFKANNLSHNHFYNFNLIDDAFQMNFLEGWSAIQTDMKDRFRYIAGKEGRLAFQISNRKNHRIEIRLSGLQSIDKDINLRFFLNKNEIRGIDLCKNQNNGEPCSLSLILPASRLLNGLNIIGFRLDSAYRDNHSPRFISLVISSE